MSTVNLKDNIYFTVNASIQQGSIITCVMLLIGLLR